MSHMDHLRQAHRILGKHVTHGSSQAHRILGKHVTHGSSQAHRILGKHVTHGSSQAHRILGKHVTHGSSQAHRILGKHACHMQDEVTLPRMHNLSTKQSAAPFRAPLVSVPTGRPWQMLAVDILEVPEGTS